MAFRPEPRIRIFQSSILSIRASAARLEYALPGSIYRILLNLKDDHKNAKGGHGSGSHTSTHHSSTPRLSSPVPGTGSKTSSEHVSGYTKKDGTHVDSYRKSTPDKSFNNNWSTKGNVNLATGKAETKVRPPKSHER